MRAKITVSTIWTTPNSGDKETMEMLKTEKPVDVCLDYLQDALRGDEELSKPEATVEILGEVE